MAGMAFLLSQMAPEMEQFNSQFRTNYTDHGNISSIMLRNAPSIMHGEGT